MQEFEALRYVPHLHVDEVSEYPKEAESPFLK